jgi:hypothetical protein
MEKKLEELEKEELIKLSRERGREGTDANGILKDFHGTVVHDSLR